MSIIDGLTHGFARLMRSTPNFKGRGRLIRVFNRSMLAAGVEPLVTAPMNEGTRMRVDLRSGTEFSSFYTGAYARDRLKELKAVMSTSTSGVFLDVGANIGFYTVAMARQLAAREDNRQFQRVIAFEPVPANYLRLKENLDLNHLGDLVRVYGHGLSDHKGEATITLREDFVAGSATGNAALSTSPERDAGFATAQVPLRRFDDLAPEFASSQHPIVAIKLDIEGHEDAFLRGGGGA